MIRRSVLLAVLVCFVGLVNSSTTPAPRPFVNTKVADLLFIIDLVPRALVPPIEQSSGVESMLRWLSKSLPISRVNMRFAVVAADNGTFKVLRYFSDGISPDRLELSSSNFNLTRGLFAGRMPTVVRESKHRTRVTTMGYRPQMPQITIYVTLFPKSSSGQLKSMWDWEADNMAKGKTGKQKVDIFVVASSYTNTNDAWVMIDHLVEPKMASVTMGDSVAEEIRDRILDLLNCPNQTYHDARCYFDDQVQCVNNGSAVAPTSRMVGTVDLLRFCLNGVAVWECRNGTDQCQRECQQAAEWSDCYCNATQHRLKPPVGPLFKYCPNVTMLPCVTTCINDEFFPQLGIPVWAIIAFTLCIVVISTVFIYYCFFPEMESETTMRSRSGPRLVRGPRERFTDTMRSFMVFRQRQRGTTSRSQYSSQAAPSITQSAVSQSKAPQYMSTTTT